MLVGSELLMWMGLMRLYETLPLPGTHKAYASATFATGYCAG